MQKQKEEMAEAYPSMSAILELKVENEQLVGMVNDLVRAAETTLDAVSLDDRLHKVDTYRLRDTIAVARRFLQEQE